MPRSRRSAASPSPPHRPLSADRSQRTQPRSFTPCRDHTIALSRMRYHAETRAYVERRIAEGKNIREIRRCLTRHLARRVYKILERTP